MYIYIYIYIHTYIYLSTYLSIYLSSIYLSFYLSIYLSIYIYTYTYTYTYTYIDKLTVQPNLVNLRTGRPGRPGRLSFPGSNSTMFPMFSPGCISSTVPAWLFLLVSSKTLNFKNPQSSYTLNIQATGKDCTFIFLEYCGYIIQAPLAPWWLTWESSQRLTGQTGHCSPLH